MRSEYRFYGKFWKIPHFLFYFNQGHIVVTGTNYMALKSTTAQCFIFHQNFQNKLVRRPFGRQGIFNNTPLVFIFIFWKLKLRVSKNIKLKVLAWKFNGYAFTDIRNWVYVKNKLWSLRACNFCQLWQFIKKNASFEFSNGVLPILYFYPLLLFASFVLKPNLWLK